jgi:hypothetical protein
MVNIFQQALNKNGKDFYSNIRRVDLKFFQRMWEFYTVKVVFPISDYDPIRLVDFTSYYDPTSLKPYATEFSYYEEVLEGLCSEYLDLLDRYTHYLVHFVILPKQKETLPHEQYINIRDQILQEYPQSRIKAISLELDD